MASRHARDGSGSDRLWALVDAAVAMSTLDLDAVLKRIVRIACKVIGARYGALGVLDESGTALSNFVFQGITAAEAERIGHLPVGHGLLGAVIADPKPIRLADLGADRRSSGFPANHPPMRTFLGVPVVAHGSVFGNLYLTEKRGGEEFSSSDEELAVALARQAGVAVENARLYAESRRREAESRRRVEEMSSLQEIGGVLLAELDPARVIRLIAQRARDLLGGHTAIVAVADEAGSVMRCEVVVGRRARDVKGMEVPIAGSVSGEVLGTGQGVVVEDMLADPRMAHPMIERSGGRSAAFAPLMQGDRASGVLAVVHTEPSRFGSHELSLLETFANMASLARRNAELFAFERERARMSTELTESRVREEMRQELMAAVLRAQEDERRRLSLDLHDSAGQTLSAILLGLKVAQQEPTAPQIRARIDALREITADAAAELRRLALELRPTVLDDLGLEAALERYVTEFQRRMGIRTSLKVEGIDTRLSGDLETVLYRVVQESLTNAAKHAKASSVRIRLTEREGTVKLRVRDDGSGFVRTEIPESRGLGLHGMRERAALVHGNVRIRSAPGRGTTVELDAPTRWAEERPDR